MIGIQKLLVEQVLERIVRFIETEMGELFPRLG
jgi:hypothetical protein